MSATRWHICDRRAFVTGAGTYYERLVVVLRDDETGEALAFYRSSGCNGGAERGEWCPFYGLAFHLGVPSVWFVKHDDHFKTLPHWHPWAPAATWLQSIDLDGLDRVELDLDVVRGDVESLRRAVGSAITLNTFLADHGAPFRHPGDADQGEWARWSIITPEVAQRRIDAVIEMTSRARPRQAASSMRFG